MRFINKAGLLAGALTTLLILASCSDSDTSTGVTTGKQLANDASTEVVMHQGTAGTGEHSNPDTNHGHSPEQQHAEPNNPTTSKVVALLSIPTPRCGNLIQEDTEQCDGGLGGNATCNTDCTLKTQRGEIIATTACGNGIVDPGEQCDDANDSNEDDCTRFCKTPVCGDGYVQGSNGEQCDDKNRIDSDGCNNVCQSSTTTVVTTTTVIEQVNDDGGTTQVATTTPAATPEGTTQEADGKATEGPAASLTDFAQDQAEALKVEAVEPLEDAADGDLWCAMPPALNHGHHILYRLAEGCQLNRGQRCEVGEEITTVCDDGYETNETKNAVCQENGQWSNHFAPPVCVAEAVKEPDSCTFPGIANSVSPRSYPFDVGSTVWFWCNDGFTLTPEGDEVGIGYVECLGGGNISGSYSCIDTDGGGGEGRSTLSEEGKCEVDGGRWFDSGSPVDESLGYCSW